MGVFSRLSDIINSNINALLDKAEDPEKLVRMIIQEMEQTLVEVRSSSARTIAEKKELGRKLERLSLDVNTWQEKAELAVSKGRDDLAKAALKEKGKLEAMIAAEQKEMVQLEAAMEKLEVDISRLQQKLNEAVSRRDAMLLRRNTIEKQRQVRKHISAPTFDHAFEKFEAFERKMDQMEAEVEAMDLGRNKSLNDQFDDLIISEKLEQELQQLKQKIASRS